MLDFTVVQRGEQWQIEFDTGDFRSATAQEIILWNRMQELEVELEETRNELAWVTR